VVLNIGSIASKRPTINRIAYAASKMALVGLTRTAAFELAPHLVRCNLISPGPVAGERLDEVTSKVSSAHGISHDDARRMILELSPMGEPAEASEVAGLAAYLCSDEARHLTGEDINLASGITAY
jgi:meso-butanediol dehydrogenase/(S,S)-butanediol dehydrogenase/diacetyl reductase